MVDDIKGETFAIIAFVTPTISYSSYPLFAHSPLPLKIASLTMTYGSESFVKSHRPAKTFNYPETNGHVTNLMRNYCVSMHFVVNVEAKQLRK